MIELGRTVDILKELGKNKGGRILVGFAAETNDVEGYALKKLREKNLDMIAANDVSKKARVLTGTRT
jgi:phosphopantothenoylcysteine decarboxylase/phosphopantothenate--cysteine ligase